MNIKKITRSDDWWGYKLSPLLAVAYATILIEKVNFIDIWRHILFLLSSIILGAAYVSVINDFTDIKQDLAAGKSNNMVNLPASIRWFVTFFCIAFGFTFAYFFYPDTLSLLLYFMSWAAFSLYSIPPIRLKIRGIWGVFADACGAHLFTSCLIVSSVYFAIGRPINWGWFTAVSIWSLSLGLRGILSHQFEDREKDIFTGVKTYASKVEPKSFKNKAIILLIIELCAFVIMLIIIKSIINIAFLFIYLAFTLLRHRLFRTDIIIIVLNQKNNYRVLMYEYYEVFLPISFLTYVSVYQPFGWLFLIVHIIVFWKNIYLTFNEILNFNALRRMLRFLIN